MIKTAMAERITKGYMVCLPSYAGSTISGANLFPSQRFKENNFIRLEITSKAGTNNKITTVTINNPKATDTAIGIKN